MDLFDWVEIAVPAPDRFGPPEPEALTLDVQEGLELIRLRPDQTRGWKHMVRLVGTSDTERLAHCATWGDFHGREIYLTEAQHLMCESWWSQFASGGRDQ